jgi:hypothetical protein
MMSTSESGKYLELISESGAEAAPERFELADILLRDRKKTD